MAQNISIFPYLVMCVCHNVWHTRGAVKIITEEVNKRLSLPEKR